MNVGSSVSRVGSKAQPYALRLVNRGLLDGVLIILEYLLMVKLLFL